MKDIQIIFDNMQIDDLHVVLKVAEFRSITAAATSLDMHIATASAALKRVEKALGVELFIRTTRQLRLSNAGERYIPHCQQAIETLNIAQQNISENKDVIDGELRLALSSDLGRNVVIPWLNSFMDLYPNVSLKTNISDSQIDFYRDPVDIALRYGSPEDGNLYGFKICNVPSLLCATQAYLDKNGTPKHPQDLVSHNGLFYQLYDVVYDKWTFTQKNKEFTIKMNGKHSSNDGDIVKRWCLADKGFAIKSCLDISADLLSGKVVNVMPEFKTRTSELWLVCPSRQSISPTMRLLRDTFREKSQQMLNQLVQKGILLE